MIELTEQEKQIAGNAYRETYREVADNDHDAVFAAVSAVLAHREQDGEREVCSAEDSAAFDQARKDYDAGKTFDLSDIAAPPAEPPTAKCRLCGFGEGSIQPDGRCLLCTVEERTIADAQPPQAQASAETEQLYSREQVEAVLLEIGERESATMLSKKIIYEARHRLAALGAPETLEQKFEAVLRRRRDNEEDYTLEALAAELAALAAKEPRA